ncbi:hypothetical protein LBP_cg2592 [Lactiplantibacillus plantarum subsp. plantarum P-8]|nr:hypothetical protein LPST_C2623 [Lactiplantibacillus plantarum ST-III]AGE40564.1 Hypothetical protein zj316_3025 [Lactiplantibacillus plantarum ZJ316]AGL65338.2 hypothetical protein LBP_cg2592 [Lactiplantibacillus plantarum subsp. plantarum P-8]
MTKLNGCGCYDKKSINSLHLAMLKKQRLNRDNYEVLC